VRYPWRATVGARSPHPARHYAALIGQALRYGLPAGRRGAAVTKLAGRHGIPEAALARALSLARRRHDDDLDALLDAVTGGWDALAARSARLPRAAPPLSALALERRSARTVFVFGDAPTPLLVLKQPRDGDLPVATEAAALREAEPAGLAPRWLGTVAGAEAQEGLPGRPLRVQPIEPGAAASVGWPAPLDELGGALARMATVTAKAEAPTQWRPQVERTLADAGLTSRSRELLTAAVRDVARGERSVLAHRDLSPQNCLIDSGGLTGLVDWETAHSHALPGIDAWVAAISYFEHGLGLVRWGEEEVVRAFAGAWTRAPFFAAARRSTAAAAGAADGVTPPPEALILVYSAVRLGLRLECPEAWPTGPWAATRTLEIVAGD
jgi:hypothetical protein